MCISAHGMSTILAVKRILWAKASRQAMSSAFKGSPPSTSRNSKVTDRLFVDAVDLAVNKGKTRATAEVDAKTSALSHTICSKIKGKLKWNFNIKHYQYSICCIHIQKLRQLL